MADRTAASAEVRDLISRTMPGVPYVVARSKVREWWELDEKTRAAAKSESDAQASTGDLRGRVYSAIHQEI